MEINLSARDLRAFMTLARTRSFSKAAQQLHLSQSALSSLIARLEDTLGARLFDRTTRTVALSAAGDILFGRADHLLDELEQTVRAVRDVAVLRRGSVAIATLPSLAARLVPALFRAFSEIHPDICLSVMDTLSAPAFELVREGRVDFALTAANPQYEDLNYKPLTTDTFVLLASVNHPLGSSTDDLPLANALAWSHISMPRTTSVRQYVDAAALKLGLQFRPSYEVDHLATIGAMVACGLGVTALPAIAADVIGNHDLTRRSIVKPAIQRSIGLVTRKEGMLSPAAASMVELLVQQVPSHWASPVLFHSAQQK